MRPMETASMTIFDGFTCGCENKLGEFDEVKQARLKRARINVLIVWFGALLELHLILVAVAPAALDSYPQCSGRVCFTLCDVS